MDLLRKTCGALVATLSVVLTEPAVAQPPWYSVTDLGTFVNETSDVTGISFFGRISGAHVTSGLTRAYLYDGSWTNLGTLGGNASSASDINASMQVTGYSSTNASVSHAFLWTPGGTNGPAGNRQMRDLGALPGGTSSEGAAINASGKVTGYSGVSSGEDHAFIFNGTNLIDIGALSTTFPNSYGQGINASGHVVGAAYDSGWATTRAFLYNGVTLSTTFIPLGGVTNASYAQAINDQGQVTGYVYDDAWNFAHAFRYTGSAVVDLGTLAGDYSYGNAINNQGVIVGGSSIDVNGLMNHAFVAVSNTMVDLNTRLDRSGTGWTLTEAKAINDWGQIVGIGQLSGVRHAFLLTPTPVVTNVSVSTSNVLVTFTAGSNVAYALQGASDVAGPWTNLMSNLTGNGTPITATNAGGAESAVRFYRVR